MEYIIVQAGGKGTRLGYLTHNKPKALVPVENLPMLFHLFKKYSDKKFVIIADYKKEVMRKYLSAFAKVKYQIVEAEGIGTCSGIRRAISLIPEKKPFMLIWSDLILPANFELPSDYQEGGNAYFDYVGLSQTFPCRWKYVNEEFGEESSTEYGVAGFFLFRNKNKLENIPQNGELVRWLKEQKIKFKTVGIGGTKEFGVLEEYNKLEKIKCRPFNKISIVSNELDGKKVFIKEAVNTQGEKLAARECSWYENAKKLEISVLPQIYDIKPLKMEYIDGKNIYDYNLDSMAKKRILETVINSIKQLHGSSQKEVDTFSIQEAYYNKTMDRLRVVQDLIPFANEREIVINGKKCKNVYFYKRELEKRVQELALTCKDFSFIHGDCTFSNMMMRNNGKPVLLDPRGYFGHQEIYGDTRYDWAKIYYSIVGNYDQFNLKKFSLDIGKSATEGIVLNIESNKWEDMEKYFFELTGADSYEIKFLHAIIWLSLTTYAWQDYDSICGAFYNGLWYLEDVL